MKHGKPVDTLLAHGHLEAQRLRAWLAVVSDTQERDTVRREVLSGISGQIWPDSETSMSRRKIVQPTLRRVWNDRSDLHRSYWMAGGVDQLLILCDRAFADSNERCEGWIWQLFTPTPENLKDDNNRNNFAAQQLFKLMETYPNPLGQRIMTEMNSDKWPPEFQRALAAALLGQALSAEHPVEDWEPALQKFYARHLSDGSPTMIRLISFDINSGLGRRNGSNKRVFNPNRRIRRALNDAYIRMKEVSSKPNCDPEAPVAVNDIRQVMEAIDHATTNPDK